MVTGALTLLRLGTSENAMSTLSRGPRQESSADAALLVRGGGTQLVVPAIRPDGKRETHEMDRRWLHKGEVHVKVNARLR